MGSPLEMENHEENPDEHLVEAEERAAAAEAARIGGAGGADEVEDESQRPLVEAGQGESEGAEQADEDLVERISETAGD